MSDTSQINLPGHALLQVRDNDAVQSFERRLPELDQTPRAKPSILHQGQSDMREQMQLRQSPLMQQLPSARPEVLMPNSPFSSSCTGEGVGLARVKAIATPIDKLQQQHPRPMDHRYADSSDQKLSIHQQPPIRPLQTASPTPSQQHNAIDLQLSEQQRRQRIQQRQQQQQWQSHPRDATAAERCRAALLSGYTPPPAYIHVNVPGLMQQTGAAISRWADLQQALDIESDSAAANLAAQAQTRLALKQDLTELTQLADAQTRHVKTKMRQMQTMQAIQAAKAAGQVAGQGDMTPGSSPLQTGGLGRLVVPGALANSEVRSFQQHAQDFNTVGTHPSAPSNTGPPSSHAGPLGGVNSFHGAGIRTPSTPSETRQGPAEEQAVGRNLDWSVASQSSFSASPSPPLPIAAPSQASTQAVPLQRRPREIKSILDRTEPGNKWAVLIEASLGLRSHESAIFKQFLLTALKFLNTFNRPASAELSQALRTCVDPRIFDPEDITRSQQRMADVYTQWTRRGQR